MIEEYKAKIQELENRPNNKSTISEMIFQMNQCNSSVKSCENKLKISDKLLEEEKLRSMAFNLNLTECKMNRETLQQSHNNLTSEYNGLKGILSATQDTIQALNYSIAELSVTSMSCMKNHSMISICEEKLKLRDEYERNLNAKRSKLTTELQHSSLEMDALNRSCDLVIKERDKCTIKLELANLNSTSLQRNLTECDRKLNICDKALEQRW